VCLKTFLGGSALTESHNKEIINFSDQSTINYQQQPGGDAEQRKQDELNCVLQRLMIEEEVKWDNGKMALWALPASCTRPELSMKKE
jgi:hypothetical protein